MKEIEMYKSKRSYNRWVANETLEDYALRFTAKKSRRWSEFHVANTALGAVSFLVLEAIGASITLNYGFYNAFLAITVVTAIIFFCCVPISYYAAKYGVDIDLLTRGAGFGYIGSTVTSLIYASFTFIFLALESAIMGSALNLLFDIPLPIGYLISAIVIIPLVTHGITLISQFQYLTQPVWLVLQLIPILYLLISEFSAVDQWLHYEPHTLNSEPVFNLLFFGAASGVLFSLIAQIGEQVDYLRFLPEKTEDNKYRWWAALLSAGPGWILIGAIKIFIGSFLAVIAINLGNSSFDAADPVYLYLIAFSKMIANPNIAIALTGLFVILCQLKINVTNAYAGSIAWSNFFSRLTHSHPGRVVWLIFNVVIALIIVELGAYSALEKVLGIYSNVAVAWISALVADLTICKPLGLSPKGIEFKRGHLYDINPVGFGSMILGSMLGIMSYLGIFGDLIRALSPFVALVSAFVSVPIIVLITRGKYYIARHDVFYPATVSSIACGICDNEFDTEDMTHCPAYSVNICSLCCTLDAKCHDQCKEGSRFIDQLTWLMRKVLPEPINNKVNTKLLQFFGLLGIIAFIIAMLFWLVISQLPYDDIQTKELITSTLLQAYLLLMIITGILTWLFVLATESRELALEESEKQAELLLKEVEAHEKTDLALQKAKESAEAASNAKSRYLSGISHEIRTPLNSMLGYAQLMERNPSLDNETHRQISLIRKSGDHLADLIEGLLDVSRIEAGKLEITKEEIMFKDVISELVNNFEFQAKKKGLVFIFEEKSALPDIVLGDEKRLRQILINLLSNAIKYTDSGAVEFTVRYKNQVAEFIVKDTGVGIASSDIDRIFQPFERVSKPGAPYTVGTGLGLTICKLLADIMGGDLNCQSQEGKGSEFKLSLMLLSVARSQNQVIAPKRISGYEGDRKEILVIDDNPIHRGLMCDILRPLGFIMQESPDAHAALAIAENKAFDLFLVDISMPGMDGITLAHTFKQTIENALIIMVSADAAEQNHLSHSDNILKPFNSYITKPVKESILLDQVQTLLDIKWLYETKENEVIKQVFDFNSIPNIDRSLLIELEDMAKLGYPTGITRVIGKISEAYGHNPVTRQLEALNQSFDFKNLIYFIKDIRMHYEQ